jgi:UDP-glucose 4-epimerase
VQRALITGGAGFIGSTLADRLLAEGIEVVVYDNFRRGRPEYVENAVANGATVVTADILDGETLQHSLKGCDVVFHLAANADVRRGIDHPQRDLEQNTVGTASVLEAMRATGVASIVFASTGSIYGEPEVFPTPEDAPFPIQTSLYGASKLAGEGLIAAYCHGFGFTGAIFRFVSILGERYTHGHVFDFARSLRRDPTRLTVLGDGRQEKSYLYVGDCIEGMLAGLRATAAGSAGIYNLGTDETIVVDDSIAVITEYLGISPVLEYTGGRRGWPGDSPLILLDCAKIRSLGWRPKLTIREALQRTLAWLETQHPLPEEAVR